LGRWNCAASLNWFDATPTVCPPRTAASLQQDEMPVGQSQKTPVFLVPTPTKCESVISRIMALLTRLFLYRNPRVTRCVELGRRKYVRGYIQKFPDWVYNEIFAYNSKHSLRSNTKGCGGKSH
jgi:hypothetical protein